MITTIERQTHEAELIALSSNSQTVSERASTFMRESSPAPSDSSSVDVPNLRASSLVQMWKEFEAEAISPRGNHSPPSNATNSNNRTNLNTNVDNSSVEDPSMGGESEICDSNNDERYDSFVDWESDQTVHSDHLSSSQERVSDASERVRVADIIRRLTAANRTHSSFTSWSDENDREQQRSSLDQQQSCVDQRSSLDQSVVSDQGDQRDVSYLVNTPRLRGRQAFLDLLMYLERERHRELNTLGERRAVSRFPQRGRIQSLLRLRFLQGGVAVQNLHRTPSLNQIRGRTPIIHLRERFTPRNEQGGATVHNRENNLQSCAPLPYTTQDSRCTSLSDQLTNNNAHHQERATSENNTATMHQLAPPAPSTNGHDAPAVQNPVAPTCACQQVDESQTLHVTISDSGDLGLEDGTDSERISHRWDGNVITEEPELDTTQNIGSYGRWGSVTEEPDSSALHIPETTDESWLSDVSHSQRGWERSQQEWFQERAENNSDDEEIHELLERRPVTNLLSSGFRERMERLILSHLQRNETIIEDAEEDEELLVERQYNAASYDSDQGASTSTSLQLPLPSRLMPFDRYEDQEAGEDSDQGAYPSLQTNGQSPSDYQGSQKSPFGNHPSLEMELICDLRGHMERIHHEMTELRKSVETCMGMQVKLQKSIKQEFAAAVSNSFRSGEAMEFATKVPAKKGNCCICYDMPVDSLLYRCGHMCTCFKCAHELQWSSSRCPICRAPILDVVRAYSNA